MAQVYKGVPAFGATLVAHFDSDGRITAINDDYYRGLNLSVEPEITAGSAVAAAQAALGLQVNPDEMDPRSWLY